MVASHGKTCGKPNDGSLDSSMVTAGGPTPDDESSHEGRVIGRYLILDEIASGGMATVHLAHVEGSDADKFVAVKCMHAHYARDPDFVSMFLDEANLCTRIRHENVVATIDVAQQKNELLLVLELVDGESLSRLVKTITARGGRVPQSIAAAVVRDMLAGLHAAHEATGEDGEALMIVHRDVSPHNVLVGTDGVVKVLDFGVAKARGRVQQTQKGQLKGKLAYMSPEQARGRTVDRRSDLFAAGIVLWEMLVGQRLFDGDNEAALLVSLLTEKPSAPSKKDPSLAKLDALVLKALATEPDERFSTAKEMAEAITAVMQPASRTEIAAWVKGEAKASLARRTDVLRRARARVAALRAPIDQDSTDHDDVPTRAVAMDAHGNPIAPAGPMGAGLQPPPRSPSSGGAGRPQPPRVPKVTVPISRSAVGVAAQAHLASRANAVATQQAQRNGAPGEDPLMWDTSTTTSDVGDRTLAGQAGAVHGAAPAFAAAADAAPRDGVDPRDATLPLYSPPAAFMAAAGIPLGPAGTPQGGVPAAQALAGGMLPPAAPLHSPSPAFGAPPVAAQAPAPTLEQQAAQIAAHHAAYQGRPSLHGYQQNPAFPPEAESRAETIPSQVTSVTLTTTDLPPPLPADHVRKLKLIAVLSGGVGALAAIALLIIATRKSPDAQARPSTSASAVTVGMKPPATTETKPIVTAPPVPTTATASASDSAKPSAQPTATQTGAPPGPAPWPLPTQKPTAATPPGGKGLLGPAKTQKR
jgi:serine/threonine protein kinase